MGHETFKDTEHDVISCSSTKLLVRYRLIPGNQETEKPVGGVGGEEEISQVEFPERPAISPREALWPGIAGMLTVLS